LLGLFEAPLPKRGLDATPAHMLVDHVSNWAASQLSGSGASNAKLICDLLSDCVRLEPGNPNHHYRLGAAYCVAGKEKPAREQFRDAQELDLKSTKSHNPEEITISSEAWLSLAYSDETPDPHAAASSVAFVARALALGGLETKQRLKAEFEKSLFFQRTKLWATYGIERVWSVADRIAADWLGVAPPKVQEGAQRKYEMNAQGRGIEAQPTSRRPSRRRGRRARRVAGDARRLRGVLEGAGMNRLPCHSRRTGGPTGNPARPPGSLHLLDPGQA
jgi:hypothetical protein